MEIFIATLAAILGAGFASGREVWVFFGAHGPSAVALGSLGAALLGAAAWRTVERTSGGGDPLQQLFGKHRRTAQILLGLFSLLTFAAVVAVLGSVGRVYWHLPNALGALAAAACAAAMAAAGQQRQRRFQAALLAAVFACGLTASGIALARPAVPAAGGGLSLQAMLGVFGFAAYNIALATDGIARSAAVGGRRGAVWAAAGGLMAGLLLTLEATALSRHGALVAHRDLPLVTLAASIHGALGALAALTVVLAGLSAASSFAVAAGDLVGGPWVAAAVAFGLSLLGVQTVVDRGYPVMAAVASAWLIVLLWGKPPRRIAVIRRKGDSTESVRGRETSAQSQRRRGDVRQGRAP